MKRFLLIFSLITHLCVRVIADPVADSRPLVNFQPQEFEQEFRNYGLWFWSEDPAERTSSSVEFIKGGDETSPTRRTLFCAGRVTAKVAIYCVSVTSARDADLLLLGFLKGYIAAQYR